VTASTVEAFIAEVQEAASRGVDIIELRLDFLQVRRIVSLHEYANVKFARFQMPPLLHKIRRTLMQCATWRG